MTFFEANLVLAVVISDPRSRRFIDSSRSSRRSFRRSNATWRLNGDDAVRFFFQPQLAAVTMLTRLFASSTLPSS